MRWTRTAGWLKITWWLGVRTTSNTRAEASDFSSIPSTLPCSLPSVDIKTWFQFINIKPAEEMLLMYQNFIFICITSNSAMQKPWTHSNDLLRNSKPQIESCAPGQQRLNYPFSLSQECDFLTDLKLPDQHSGGNLHEENKERKKTCYSSLLPKKMVWPETIFIYFANNFLPHLPAYKNLPFCIIPQSIFHLLHGIYKSLNKAS